MNMNTIFIACFATLANAIKSDNLNNEFEPTVKVTSHAADPTEDLEKTGLQTKTADMYVSEFLGKPTALKTGLIYCSFALVLIMVFYCTWVGAEKEEQEEMKEAKEKRANLRRSRLNN